MGRILVVDDEESARFFLQEILTRDGHEVVAVESSEAALAQPNLPGFDLALIDLRLPGLNGVGLLSELRQQAADTVVIVLTANASLDSAIEALRKGAHDYLLKPCKAVDMRESVRTALLK